MFQHYSFSVLERFIRYAGIDTQSDPKSTTCPSTEKQKELGNLLVLELQQLGLVDAELDEFGYVYATLPSNTNKNVPVICFCSHMDTSPDCSGQGVEPLVHKNYQGQDIVLPKDHTQILKFSEHPALAQQLGNDIVTASGDTLLGADNKAGIAEIMDAIQFLVTHPELKHGTIKILFTPDEEIGRGVDKVNLQKLGAQVAYTVDGETLGHLEDETFSADAVNITIHGFSTHPGFAKGKMENAIKIASDILDKLPKHYLTPETTEGKEGFIHPTYIGGTIEKVELKFIIRDFTTPLLNQHELLLENTVKEVLKNYPKSTYQFEVVEQYRNMKEILDKNPLIVSLALQAIQRAGITPVKGSIRGGTDGSRLSYMGLPCPNLFAGEHAFHSKLEWVSVQDMQAAVKTLVHLALIWEESS